MDGSNSSTWWEEGVFNEPITGDSNYPTADINEQFLANTDLHNYLSAPPASDNPLYPVFYYDNDGDTFDEINCASNTTAEEIGKGVNILYLTPKLQNFTDLDKLFDNSDGDSCGKVRYSTTTLAPNQYVVIFTLSSINDY